MDVKQSYWDVQVLDTNNYVTIDGAIHKNSGKSSGCLWELIWWGTQIQDPAPRDKIRYTRFAVVRNCYDEETEILTEKRGWVLFRDLLESDKVAMLQDNKMVFASPTAYFQYPHNGEMVSIESENVSLLVTPEHNLWTSTRTTRKKIWREYRLKKASDLYGIGALNRMSAVSDGWQEGLSDLSPTFFEFLGFWFAEGYAGIYPRKEGAGLHYRLIITQKKETAYIEDLLDKLKFKYGKCQKPDGNGCYNYTLSTASEEIKALIKMLSAYGKATNKSVPAWIKEAPIPHLKAFIRGYQKGDGNIKTGNHNCDRLHTASKQLADDLHEIIVRSGKSAVVHKTADGMYNVSIRQKIREHPLIMKNDWKKVDYYGNVYCVEVPTHVVYVRRNGKAVWCGQSYRQLLDTTIKTVLDWLPENHMGHYRSSEHDYVVTGFQGAEIELMFRALDRPDHISNLLSMELTGAWVNESREVPWAIIDALDGRIDRYPSVRDGGCTRCGIIMDTNPPDDDSEFYNYFEVIQPDNAEIFHQPSGQSPQAENLMTPEEYAQYIYEMRTKGESDIVPGLKPDYYTNLAKGKKDDYIKVYIDGEYGFVKEGKPVYDKSWNESLHLSKTPLFIIPVNAIIIGLDFGLTPAAVICQLTPRGRFQVLRELESEGLGFQQFVRNMLKPMLNTEFTQNHLIFTGDPAGNSPSQTDEKTCYDILREEKFVDHPSVKIIPARSNDLVARVGAVEDLLSRLVDGQPVLQLDPSCKTLRKGFNSKYLYRRIQTAGDRFTDEPVKNKYSHPHDGLQYAAQYVVGDIKREQRKLPGSRGMRRHRVPGRGGY